MLHLFMGKEPWFRAKRYGIGASLPIRWQGWALIAAHSALMVGTALALTDRPTVLIPLLLFIAVAPIPVYHRRTKGGWHWRWGP